MKLRKLWAAPLALGTVLAVGQFTAPLQAQSQNQTQPQSQTQPQNQTPDAQQDQQKPRTFVGKIIKLKDGRFALLTDAQGGKGAYLDDQAKAAPFEGKTVKVTGTLEVAKALIHVTDIQPA